MNVLHKAQTLAYFKDIEAFKIDICYIQCSKLD